MPASIQTALSETSLSLEQMHANYAPFLSLTSRILGSPPHFLALAYASPLTHIFYLAALRPCFYLPECDLNMTSITPSMRRTALLESSIVHQCPYCTAHTAAMGDVIKGSMVSQCARTGDLQVAFQDHETVKQLVAEVCTFPGVLTEDTKRRFVKEHGDDAYTQIASMLAFMGWLNYAMGATGMRLESRMLPFAEVVTKDRELPFDLKMAIKDDNEEDIGQGEVANVRKRGLFGMLLEHAKNAWGLLGLIGPVASAGLAEKNWFAAIPSTVAELDDWCTKVMKCELTVFTDITDIVLKRSFALGLSLVFEHEDPLWTPLQKSLFLYVFATGVMNDRLKDDALKLYQINGGHGDLNEVLMIAGSSDVDPVDAFEAGLKFMHVSAGFADNVTERIVDGLIEHVKEHRSIVDLCGMVGHFGFWQRASVLYPGN